MTDDLDVSPRRGWADSHVHLQWEDMGDEAVVAARAEGVSLMICVGTGAQTSREAVELASRHHDVWATVGLHPHDASEGLTELAPLWDAARVVGVGECGLDYHYEHSPRDRQREVFAGQIRLAHELDRTLVIHTREAWDDTFAVLAESKVPPRTVFHCFTGGPQEATRALDIGAWLSFSGIVTFKGAADVAAAAALCPAESLLIETDAPYLSPAPFRGQPNRPGRVARVGEVVADIRATSVDEIRELTRENTRRAFAIR